VAEDRYRMKKHMRTEEALLESEERFREMVENINDTIFSIDTEGYITYVSPGIEHIYGYKAQEVIGEHLSRFFHPDDMPGLLTSMVQTLAGQLKPYEFRVFDSNGGVRYVRTSSRPIMREGKPLGINGILTDITDSKRVEEELRTAHRNLTDIIEFLPDATLVIDREGCAIAWNRAMEDITGIKKEDILGKGGYLYAVPFYGEPRPTLIDLVLADESDPEYQYDYIRREGKTFFGEAFTPLAFNGKGGFFSAKASPLFDKDGNIIGAIESIRDITGMKHLEERFKLAGKELQLALEKLGERELIDRIIQTSPAGIIVINNDKKITFTNARAVQLLGLKTDDQNPGAYKMPKRHFIDHQGNPVPSEVLVYHQVVSTGSQVFDVAQAIQWQDGTRTLLSVNGAPLYDRSGAIEGVILSFEDVTLRREAEERISRYQKQLRALATELALVEEQERRRIAEGIHDHVGQFLALARLKIGALTKAAELDATKKELDEINSLIGEAIKNTRILTFELSPPILYDLGFGAAVEWLGEQLLEKNGVGFKLINKKKPKSLSEELSVILFTTVRELFINIVKHARAKKVTISIEKTSDKIMLEIQDDGAGFRTSLNGSDYRKVAGFGLFSIHERLEHLGGRLEIVSRPGRGSCITIAAPLTGCD
jgi:PAS domain S-box-containing protein